MMHLHLSFLIGTMKGFVIDWGRKAKCSAIWGFYRAALWNILKWKWAAWSMCWTRRGWFELNLLLWVLRQYWSSQSWRQKSCNCFLAITGGVHIGIIPEKVREVSTNSQLLQAKLSVHKNRYNPIDSRGVLSIYNSKDLPSYRGWLLYTFCPRVIL